MSQGSLVRATKTYLINKQSAAVLVGLCFFFSTILLLDVKTNEG